MQNHKAGILPSIAIIILVSQILVSCKSGEKESSDLNAELFQQLDSKRVLLPDGWSLTPPANSMDLGDFPMNLVLSSSRRLAAVTNNGRSIQTLMLFDTQNEKLLDQIEISKSWFGLKFSEDEKRLYASGGNDNMIRIYEINNNKLTMKDSLVLGPPWPVKISPTGLELNESAHELYTVTKEDSALYIINIENHTFEKIALPTEGYTCLLGKQRDELYISLWGGGKVAVFDLKAHEIADYIEVESHPNDMVITGDGRYLYVANANSNSVSVIDLTQRKVVENIGTALFPDAPAGSTPNGLALSSDESRLYIANANNNCLAVFDVSEKGEGKGLGFIPTGWYPTSVKVAGHKILVANGKGERSLPNPKGPNPYLPMHDSTQYIGRLFKGTLSIIPVPDENDLNTYSKLVYSNTPYNKKVDKIPEGNPIPVNIDGQSPIKHVFYVIKENRTYDQVFGDIPSGNGDPNLCLFSEEITPNHHKLATEFVLFDNFYVNAEVSADGHNWTMAAYATDFVEKTWPTSYGQRGGNYDYEGSREIAFPEKGYLWDYCQRAGISYRSYAEFIGSNGAQLESLKGHYDADFPVYNLAVMDTLRFHKWSQDFDSLLSIDQVPQFNTIRLPNDHTSGAKLGMPTPKSQVADNDLALGKLVEKISHSSIWDTSVIFVLEDDAQNGPDHVDAHRSILLVISPYAKRKFVDHTMYTTASVLHTMELILGLPPMSQYDAAATPFYKSFTSTPDLTPYECLANTWPLDEMNTERNKLSEMSEEFNLETEDAAPDIAFNQVIWKTVKGIDSEMPPPNRGAFVRLVEETGDE
ncbi:MAG: bifunctional YncE family protein/alkaline phosphatase family protein [Cyclobacteriaceae bacterium]|nr:bifunctional YncE family protein/alkaline phosphatase family protein [Cyclobacteriaceae bacterium]